VHTVCLPIYPFNNQSINQFSSGPPVTVSSNHSRRCAASSHVKFPCHISRSTSFFHFISDRSHHRLPPAEHVVIPLGQLTCSIRTKYPYHINILFSILYKILLLLDYPQITSFLLSNSASPCCVFPKLHSCISFNLQSNVQLPQQ
jgi:hypothetical protein